jgi:hypothetical protein
MWESWREGERDPAIAVSTMGPGRQEPKERTVRLRTRAYWTAKRVPKQVRDDKTDLVARSQCPEHSEFRQTVTAARLKYLFAEAWHGQGSGLAPGYALDRSRGIP